MPGAYAQIMLQQQMAGRWPVDLITLMLHYNTMHGNFNAGMPELNYQMLTDANVLASCHPNAIMFMNMVCAAPYANDMAPAVMVGDAAAAVHVAAAQAAVLLDNRAIWVKYGSGEGHSHSIVLLTGTSNIIEPLEGWAGAAGYFFHESVVEADTLGGARNRPRPTRAAASTALGNLIAAGADDGLGLREAGWDALSRSGAGYAPRDGQPIRICVHVENMVDEATFRTTVRRRLEGVGYYKARAVERFRRLFACCHCQTTTWYRWMAHNWGWRECATCHRHYCQLCARLLLVVGDSCDCGQATNLM